MVVHSAHALMARHAVELTTHDLARTTEAGDSAYRRST